MRVLLTLSSADGRPAGANAQRVVDGTTVTVGRGPMNDWVLEDPQRYLSKNHCVIEFDGSGYRLVDTSTNGTYVNNADTPVGKGSSVPLSMGDRIRLGSYEISLSPADHMAAPLPADDPLGDLPPPMDDPFGADPFDPNAASLAPGAAAPGGRSGRGRQFESMDDPLGHDESARDDPYGVGVGAASRERPGGADDPFSPPAPGTQRRGPDPFGIDAPGPPTGAPRGAADLGDDPFGPAPGDDFGRSRGRGRGDDFGHGPSDEFGHDPQSGGPAPGGRGIPADFDFLGEDEGFDPGAPTQDDHLPSERAAFVAPDPLRRRDTAKGGALPADWDIEDLMGPGPSAGPGRAAPGPAPRPSSRPSPAGSDDDLPFEIGPAKVSARSERITPGPRAQPREQVPPEPFDEPPPRARDVPSARPTPAPPPPRQRSQPMPGGSDAWSNFLAGAGIDAADLSPEEAAALAGRFGAAFRAALQGLVEILQVRASLKEQFQVPERTMIRADDNNPLKFVVDADQALEQLVRPRRGFLEADAAVENGFKDIKAHLLAEAAGLQVALSNLIARFDPETLRERLEGTSMWDSLMPAGRRAKYWDVFVETYGEIAREAEDDFNGLLGREFARAYDEQIRKL
ncbi:MAG: type VI secretion system-associated FHA domain protein TagH [Rhodospirillaceae bacterium]|nr:type VI secretion system-associated FHA domain protein TagH [Rhodospirillaceae bacterium]